MSTDILKKAYSSPPIIYDLRGFLILTFSYNSTLFSQIKFFNKNIGKKHLDVAVGTGTLLFIILTWRRFKKMAPVDITAIDYVPTMLEGGKKYFDKNPNVHLEIGDVTNLIYPSNTFDTVNIANSMHCFSDIDAALKEVYRVLKPGGTFASNILLYPKGIWPLKQIANKINTWGMKKGILFTPYDKSEIKNKILNSGFILLAERESGNSYNILVQK